MHTPDDVRIMLEACSRSYTQQLWVCLGREPNMFDDVYDRHAPGVVWGGLLEDVRKVTALANQSVN